MDCSVNKKWLFCKENHFLFSDQVKKMSLGQSGKNGPKTQFRLKLAFFYLIRRPKVIFFTKKSLSVSWPCQKLPYLAQIGFLAHFCHFGPVTFFLIWSGTKKWIFSQNNHFLFAEQSILMARNISCSNNSNLFWQILLLRPKVKDFETWGFWIPRESPLTLQ